MTKRILSVLLCAAILAAFLLIPTSAAEPGINRSGSMYCWETYVLSEGSYPDIKAYFDALNITRIYQQLGKNYLASADTVAGVRRLQNDGIEVVDILGENRELGLKGADLSPIKQEIDRLAAYNSGIGSGAKITKLALDVETYTYPQWKSNPYGYFSDFIGQMQTVYNYAHSKGIRIVQVIPPEFDDISGSLFRQFVTTCADELSLMNYTKSTMVNAISGEVALCKELNMPLETILETMPYNDYFGVTEANTYFYEGFRALTSKRDQILSNYNTKLLTASYHHFPTMYHVWSGKYMAQIYAYTSSNDPNMDKLGQTKALRTITLKGSDGSTITAGLCNLNLDQAAPECCYLAMGVKTGVTYTVSSSYSCYTVNTPSLTFSVDAGNPMAYSFISLQYKAVSCSHKQTVVRNQYNATCTAQGYTGDKYCAQCGALLQTGSAIAAKGHTAVKDAAVPATATSTGLTEGSHCSVCGTVIVAQQTVAKLAAQSTNLPGGVYTIKAAGGNFRLDVSGKSTEAGANVHLWTAHNGNVQKWIVRPLGNGYYSIQNYETKLYLDVSGANSANGTNVHQWTANTSIAQQWKFTTNADGSLSILSACGGKALDVSGGNFADGGNIHIWDYCANLNQKWELTAVPMVQDGVYTLANAADTAFALENVGGATASGTNIAIGAVNNRDQQKFVIRNDGYGYYTIRHAASGKALDVSGNGQSNGANIILYDYTGGNNQKWTAIPNANGSFTFISKVNGLALDMSGGGAPKAGTNIQCWASNQSTAQQWSLIPVTIGKEGVYSIAPSGSSAFSMAVSGSSTAQGANIQLGTDKQQFVLVSFEGGYYGIRPVKSGKYLNASGNGTENGTNLIQYGTAAVPAANERWAVIPNFDGTYSFVNKLNGLYLDLSGNSLTVGANIQLWGGNGSGAQKWRLSAPAAPIADGTYQLLCASSVGFALDVNTGSGNVTLWSKHTGDNQKFTFTHMGNGFYKITCKATGKVLDVNGAAAKAGTNVQQYAYNGTDAQLWAAVPNANGSYTFFSKLGGFVLDVSGGSFADGTNIQIWTPNGTAAQTWKLG